MYWNGTNLYLTGNINATGGKFTGNVQLAIPTGGTTSGTLYAGANPTSGARVRLSSEGIFAYNSTSIDNTTGLTFSLQQSTGQIDARSGTVGGWTLATTGFSSSNTKIENTGVITLGDTTGTLNSIVKLDASHPTYRLWIGSQDPQTAANNHFAVTKEGKLYATGAVFGGYSTTEDTTAAKNAAIAAAASDATTKANAAQTAAATDAQARANAAQAAAIASASQDAQTRATAARDAAILASVAKDDFNRAAIIGKINNSTAVADTVTISGGQITAGTISADAVVSTFISAFEIEATKIKVGTLTGHILQAGLTGTSYYLNTKGTKAGIDGLVVNAIGIESSRTGGVTTHWYPYTAGGNFDLGTYTFRWNDIRLSGNIMVGHNGNQDDDTGTTVKTKLLGTGAIYANTLGTATTSNFITQSSGFLRVNTSSSRRYKTDIVDIESVGGLDPSNLLNIPVRAFKYNAEHLSESDQRFGVMMPGFIAEEVELAYPVAVDYNDDGTPERWNTNMIVPGMLALIQKQSLQIDSLKQRLDALEA